MPWLAALLIAGVSNLDNLAVGVALGMRGTRVILRSNLIIAAVTMAATAIAMTAGDALSGLFPSSVADASGSLIIMGIGVATVVAALKAFRSAPSPRSPRRVYRYQPHSDAEVVTCRGAFALGVVLSLNNLGAGVGAGVAGIPPLATTLLAGGFSLLCVGGGSSFGAVVRHLVLGRRAPLVAGIVLVAVGATMLPGVR
jgi:putative Mn2+ efflux pump MntP